MTLFRMAHKTRSELLDEVNKHIGLEKAFQGRNISGLSAFLPSSKRHDGQNSPYDQERGGKKIKDKTSAPEDKPKPQFTLLIVPLGEAYAHIGPDQLPEPRKMKTSDKKKDTSKYCRYHKDHGHDTVSCWKLKEGIEKLIQRGQLRQYIDKKKENPHKEKEKDHAGEIP